MNAIWRTLLLGALVITSAHAELPSPSQTATVTPVDLAGEAPPDMAALVRAYERVHDQVTPEGVDALFAPGFEVFGSNLPPAGLKREGTIAFLEKLRGTTFRQVPDKPLMLTRDGRIVMHWTLKAGERLLASGVDTITVEGGRIRRIVGVY
ncbi:MAG: nuclear transport factor 2 family protein [Rhizobacter sp.]